MLFVIRRIIGTLLGIVVLMFLGRFIFATFPELVPLWEEAKSYAVYLFNLSVSKIGIVGTVILIVAAVSAASVAGVRR